MAKRKGRAQGLLVADKGNKKARTETESTAAAKSNGSQEAEKATVKRNSKKAARREKKRKLQAKPQEDADDDDESDLPPDEFPADELADADAAALDVDDDEIPGDEFPSDEPLLDAPAAKTRKAKVPSTEAATVDVSKVNGKAGAATPAKPWDVLTTPEARPSPQSSFEWLVWPLTPAEFLSQYWEKKPLHLRRGNAKYYDGLFSKADLDKLLRAKHDIRYGDHINLAKYDPKLKQKVLLNKGERGVKVTSKDVEAAWAAGSSIQAMHPQQYHKPVWSLMAALEPSFGCLFGANSYITPPKHQGFAPHFDDVEVFMLQTEGAKRWRLYTPPEGEEYPLPRSYSRDFKPEELGEPILDCVLEAGDLLYLPRGTVHCGVVDEQARGAAGDGAFSHHLTVSTYQKTSWCQVLEKALSSAVERATAESEEFREGLPVGFLNFMGSWHDCGAGAEAESEDARQTVTDRRSAFKRRLAGLMKRLQDFMDLDEVCDEMAVDYMAYRLPPVKPEESETPAPKIEKKEGDDGEEEDASAVSLQSEVRWLDPTAIRPMISTDPESSETTVMLFHSCGNPREQHMNRAVEAEEDVGCLRFEASTFLPALKFLLAAGSKFVRVKDLPLFLEDDRIALCDNLVTNGLLEHKPGDPATAPTGTLYGGGAS
eukprot:TRINITY_DN122081_c0_g1_i1.p1 TRINITY_DN122081_c0_g1~~TRINITY_DN122081_c0_g1_i1.p1  ORF type:complete len:656 (+),score=176.94 TRINITY_DN122081_c0_g1_i1:164-2131(+)